MRARDILGRPFPTRCNHLDFHARKPRLHMLHCHHTIATGNIEPCASNCELESSNFNEKIIFIGTFICPHPQCRRLRYLDERMGTKIEAPVKSCQVVDEEFFADPDEFDPEEVRRMIRREEREQKRAQKANKAAERKRRWHEQRKRLPATSGNRITARHGLINEITDETSEWDEAGAARPQTKSSRPDGDVRPNDIEGSTVSRKWQYSSDRLLDGYSIYESRTEEEDSQEMMDLIRDATPGLRAGRLTPRLSLFMSETSEDEHDYQIAEELAHAH